MFNKLLLRLLQGRPPRMPRPGRRAAPRPWRTPWAPTLRPPARLPLPGGSAGFPLAAPLATRAQTPSPVRASRLISVADTSPRGHAPPAREGWAAGPARALTGKPEVSRRAAGVSAAVAHFVRRPGLHHSPKIGRQVWEAGSGAHRLGPPRAPRRSAPRAPCPHPRPPHGGPRPPGARRPVWGRPRRADFSASPSVYRGRRCGSVL